MGASVGHSNSQSSRSLDGTLRTARSKMRPPKELAGSIAMVVSFRGAPKSLGDSRASKTMVGRSIGRGGLCWGP